MAKSIRSKIKKRFRTAKRQRMDAMVYTPQIKLHNENLNKVIQGRAVIFSRPKNAFKEPDAEGAVFPQHEVIKPIDFRAQSLPMAGFAFRGGRRKYAEEQAEEMYDMAHHQHPKMQVLAGGGAIVSKTGQRISLNEAEFAATLAERPAAAALASSGPSTAASAVAAAVAADDDEMGDAASSGEEDPDVEARKDDADHTRRPVLKDARRAGRAAEHRPRANSTKKKAPPKVLGARTGRPGGANNKAVGARQGKRH